MLEVIEKLSGRHPQGTKVVLRSTLKGAAAITELGPDNLTAVRRLATNYAQESLGVASPRIQMPGGSPAAYPVTADGISLDDVRDTAGRPLPLNHPKCTVKEYRRDVELQSGAP